METEYVIALNNTHDLYLETLDQGLRKAILTGATESSFIQTREPIVIHHKQCN